ncbi:MAG: hypothetical protein IJ969_00725 [Anaerotignum sp.]|nr:hypothetical protein [Anaerotignum sp.]
MKKRILFSLFFALLLSACTPKTNEIPEEKIAALPEGITMTVDKETITPEGASFLLLQTTELDIQYGDDYKLQKLEGSQWVDVPIIIDDYAFHAIAYELPKDKPQTLEIDWAWLYGSLPAGEYRLVKEFMDFRGTGDYDIYTITAAFTIE